MVDNRASLAEIARALRSRGVPPPIVEIVLQLVETNSDVVPSPPLSLPPSEDKSLGEIARSFWRMSLSRTDIVGYDQIHDPAWHMLLTLFADVEEGRRVTIKSLINASGSPSTTSLRALDALVKSGLISREDDTVDHRRVIIKPIGSTMDRMRDTIRRFCVPPPQ